MKYVGILLVSLVAGMMPFSAVAFRISGNKVDKVDLATIGVDGREYGPDLLIPVLTREVTNVDSTLMRQEQAEAQAMIGRLGKKFENPLQRVIVERAMSYMQLTDDKCYAKVRSDYEKDVISKKLKDYLLALDDDYSEAIAPSVSLRSMVKLMGRKNRSRVDMSDYHVTKTDTIANPCIRQGYGMPGVDSRYADWVMDSRLDALYAVRDWLWVFGEQAESRSEEFPANVSWLRYKSHPQYRIIPIRLTIGRSGTNFAELWPEDYCNTVLAFDNKGNLINVIWCELPDPHGKGREHYVARQIYAQAYDADDYNIQSYGAATAHYIKAQIGLEELTAKEKNDVATVRKQYDNAVKARDKARALYGRSSVQARQAEADVNRLAIAVVFDNGGAYDKDGESWLNAIKSVWLDKFFGYSGHVACVERTGDLSFRKIYFNKHMQPICRIDYDFYSNGAYDVNIRQTFTRLSDDPDAVKEIFTESERMYFDNKNGQMVKAINDWLRTQH